MDFRQYYINLKELTAEAELIPESVCNTEISTVTNDSKRVTSNSIFCAIAGAKHDGHQYLQQAVDNGTAALVIHQDFKGTVPQNVPVIRVSNSYFAWSRLCETAYGNPADSLSLHTVTGTNGKTSIAFLLHHLLYL